MDINHSTGESIITSTKADNKNEKTRRSGFLNF